MISLISCIEAVTSTKKVVADKTKIYSQEEYLADSNTIDVTVNVIHGLDINEGNEQSLLHGQTIYFAKTLTNVGNTTDNISLKMSEPSDKRWQISLILDSNKDGIHQLEEDDLLANNLKIPPASQHFFFIKMKAPSSNARSLAVELTVSSSFSSIGNYQGNNNVSYGGFSLITTNHLASIVCHDGPSIADIKFDDAPIRQTNNKDKNSTSAVFQEDYVGTNPLITAKIMDIDGVNAKSITIRIDGYRVDDKDIIMKKVSDTEYALSYQVKNSLSGGIHAISFEVKDTLGNLGVKTVFVQVSSKPKIVGKVLPYPNPFNPDKGETKITYKLTGDTRVIIYVYTITGERIWTTTCDSGCEGGRVGYNEVVWNGDTGFHSRVPNGVYLVQIVNSKGKLMGKTKILVIR